MIDSHNYDKNDLNTGYYYTWNFGASNEHTVIMQIKDLCKTPGNKTTVKADMIVQWYGKRKSEYRPNDQPYIMARPNFRSATSEEAQWLDECIKQHRFVPQNEITINESYSVFN